MYHGRDITDSGVQFREGSDLDGIEIVLTNRRQPVSGLVTTANGQGAVEGVVIMFAQDRDLWISESRFDAVGLLDQNGRYAIRSLPAGDYFAVAVESIGVVAPNGPALVEYRDRLSRYATRVTIRDGDSKTLDLKLLSQKDLH